MTVPVALMDVLQVTVLVLVAAGATAVVLTRAHVRQVLALSVYGVLLAVLCPAAPVSFSSVMIPVSGSAATCARYPSRRASGDLRVCRASGSTVEITRSSATLRAIRHRPAAPALQDPGPLETLHDRHCPR